jgi:hypothetical protein
VTVLEREVERLKSGQPDVVAERVTTLSGRITDLRLEMREDMSGLKEQLDDLRRDRSGDRKVLIGFLVSVALVALGLALTNLFAAGVGG